MAEDRVPLFVRLPRGQAAALDKLAGSTGRRKQHLVSELLGNELSVGRVELRDKTDTEDVLTLAEAAEMLRLPEEAVLARAQAGEMPGRRFGEEWRFTREAVLRWLSAGEDASHTGAGAMDDD